VACANFVGIPRSLLHDIKNILRWEILDPSLRFLLYTYGEISGGAACEESCLVLAALHPRWP
jgi:hypothetical protein